jgi:competence protein ComEA
LRSKATRETLAWLAVAFLVGVAAGALIVSLSGRSSPTSINIATPLPRATQQATVPPGPIKVFISGEVLTPAVYELPAGAIIEDIVRSAGGFTETANKDVVNLALRLDDGMHIHVPGLEEEVAVPLITGGSGTSGLSEEGMVNINVATVTELETLPGIGPSLAQAIVDYREMNGAFDQIDDIQDVSGIGPAKFDGLKDLITVD